MARKIKKIKNKAPEHDAFSLQYLLREFANRKSRNYSADDAKHKLLLKKNEFINKLNIEQLEIFNELEIMTKKSDDLASRELIKFIIEHEHLNKKDK